MTPRDWAQVILSIAGVVVYFTTIWLICQVCRFNDNRAEKKRKGDLDAPTR